MAKKKFVAPKFKTRPLEEREVSALEIETVGRERKGLATLNFKAVGEEGAEETPKSIEVGEGFVKRFNPRAGGFYITSTAKAEKGKKAQVIEEYLSAEDFEASFVSAVEE